MSPRKRVSIILSAAVVMVALISCLYAEEVSIKVSPNVLNLQNQGEVVTVHTDISYSLVVGSSVYLNGVPISHWKSDNRGNFVAKFIMEQVKDLPLNIGGYNTLTLVGVTVNGDEFTGSSEIIVVNNIPKK